MIYMATVTSFVTVTVTTVTVLQRREICVHVDRDYDGIELLQRLRNIDQGNNDEGKSITDKVRK